MTSYHGGKQRIGYRIADVICEISLDIEKSTNFKIKGYCEPFCGMLGVYKHIPELFSTHSKLHYKSGDANKDVILMWKNAKKGWIPPLDCSEKLYNNLKTSRSSALKGYIGHQYSFRGQYFSGFSPKYGRTVNSVEVINRIVDISTRLRNVNFKFCSYEYFSNLKGYVIYCDPPYEHANNVYYSNNKKSVFDHDTFWNWCRYMSDSNIMFISSYSAPKDFRCVFSLNRKLSNYKCKNKSTKRTEKVFMIK